MGNKGRTNLRYLLLGSTAERLLTELPCSVLCVRTPERSRALFHP
jgi:nucleotide-binding universal stress UspA family protein